LPQNVMNPGLILTNWHDRPGKNDCNPTAY
jgi:hypothetical protein